MRKLVCFSLCLMLLMPVAWAHKAPKESIASAPSGLLWRVERSGLASSWLYGTIHLANPEVARLPVEAAQAIDQAKFVVTELQMEDASASVGNRIISKSPVLPELLGDEDFARLRMALALRGYSNTALISQLNPWAAWMLLQEAPSTEDKVLPLDFQVAERGKARQIPCLGIETMDEQLSLFEKIDTERVIRLIRLQLEHANEANQSLQQMKDAYLRADLPALQQLARDDIGWIEPEDREWAEQFQYELLEKRNLRMAERLQKLLSQGGAFVAVGALHLPGNTGLIKQLQRQGYRVSVIKISNLKRKP